jgi:DNA polymerase elongation subunit (family B)
MADSKSMYSALHYDRYSGKMFYWLTDGTKNVQAVKHRFYTPIRGQYNALPCGMTDIYGREVYEVITDGKKEGDIRQDNIGRGNLLSECDIDFKTRWLENFYKGQEDLIVNMNNFNVCYLDIEVASNDRFPTADKADYPVNCVTIYFSKLKKFLVFGLNRDLRQETKDKLAANNATYINCPTEKNLLESLFTAIGDGQVDILTAYNAGFDIKYLVNRAAKPSMQIDLKLLSRLPTNYKSAYISKRDGMLNIGGTEILDYLALYKKFTLKERDNFKLDTIGELEVGEKKAPLPDGYKSWIKYWDEWVWYNFKDVELMTKIENKRKLFEITIGACAEARVNFNSIFEEKKMLVGFILKYLHTQNIVMPPLIERTREPFPGAYVYATPGYYDLLVSYDYRSMYPSIIMGANISPETKVMKTNDGKFVNMLGHTLDVKESDLVKSPWKPSGNYEVFYSKEKEGIIPIVTKIIFNGRTQYKKMSQKYAKEGNKELANIYDTKQKSYKIFGNALYGLLGSPFFQFYDIDNSASITSFGVKLITNTVENLCNYFENDFEKDERYFSAFGEMPVIDKKLNGSYYNEKNQLCYRRLSHGDTDSFFVKYEDIYKSFSTNVDKKVSVIVFEGNKVLHRTEFDISNEKQAKVLFNKMCIEYGNSIWDALPDEKKKSTFKDGMLNAGKYRIIYNRFCLTDYCRILDAVMMEDILANIMQNYSDYWNLRENTMFLKREKCIIQAIVTAKKKYICNVESNEDAKIYDEKDKFKITGLEIVRSSTTPFTREHILDLVKELLKNKDKAHIRKRYLDIKRDFFKLIEEKKYYSISIPSGIKSEPPEYTQYQQWSDEDRKIDWRPKSASVWNHLISSEEILKDKMLEPIYESAKAKFIKVNPNKYGIKAIAYVGNNCPEELFQFFTPDWQTQWDKSFANVMDRFFVAIGWGKNFEEDQRESMLEIF